MWQTVNWCHAATSTVSLMHQALGMLPGMHPVLTEITLVVAHLQLHLCLSLFGRDPTLPFAAVTLLPFLCLRPLLLSKSHNLACFPTAAKLSLLLQLQAKLLSTC